MKISATITNAETQHHVVVQTNDNQQSISVAAKPAGQGSAVNGGEFLCVALATCFCNDIYREARKKQIKVNKVTVNAWAEFGGEGEAGTGFCYQANVDADAPAEVIEQLIKHTDRVAEIQKTLRQGTPVKLIID